MWWTLFCIGYFSSRYFDPSPIPLFLAQLFFLAVAALVLASAAGYGWPVVRKLMPQTLPFAERALFATATGLGLLSLLMMLAGCFGFWTRPGALLLVVIGLVSGWTCWHRLGRPLSASAPPTPREPMSWPPLIFVGLGVLLTYGIAYAPITYYDSLVYHLALPQTYVRAGRWVGLPELIYSSFPQNLEMLWTVGLLLAGDGVSNVIGWELAMLGLIAVYLFGKRFLGRGAALWATALLGTMPSYMLLSSGGYVDVGLTLFSFTSFYAVCLWKQSQKPGLLVVAGTLAGLAIGTKYTGAIPMCLHALLILLPLPSSLSANGQADPAGVRMQTLKGKKVFLGFFTYTLTALLVFCPWMIKNLFYVGNPVFPFFYRWSLKNLNPWVGDAAAGYFQGLVEYAPRSGWHLAKLVWDIGVNGLDFGGGIDVLGNLGWGLLFAPLPALWLVKRRLPITIPLLIYVTGFFVSWGMSRPVLRFLMPLAPVLALLTAYAYDQGIRSQPSGFRLFGRMVLGGLWISGLWLFFQVSDLLSLFRVPMGFQTRSEYLTRKLNYYAAASFVNALPADTLTYVVGDQRRYYYNKPVLVTPVFNKNPLTEWANAAPSPEALAKTLRDHHITHLLINHAEMKRLDAVYRLFPFTPHGQNNWDRLKRRLAKPIYHDTTCEILVLPSRDASMRDGHRSFENGRRR